ncbi:hypothetical protein [Frankia sp. R82]|uniref:hypothetical protein n=1 Tax=Frankia sp. R82 TaxID=2950553 RepID=UPI002043EE97|nr:hypothetical protein [Frankia sp. R82]MCM3884153.1 hypothetical protein [Frankia sp. R82]
MMLTAIQELAAALAEEDRLEERGVLAAGDRTTCHTHQSWARDCAANPAHVQARVNSAWATRALAVLQGAR